MPEKHPDHPYRPEYGNAISYDVGVATPEQAASINEHLHQDAAEDLWPGARYEIRQGRSGRAWYRNPVLDEDSEWEATGLLPEPSDQDGFYWLVGRFEAPNTAKNNCTSLFSELEPIPPDLVERTFKIKLRDFGLKRGG